MYTQRVIECQWGQVRELSTGIRLDIKNDFVEDDFAPTHVCHHRLGENQCISPTSGHVLLDGNDGVDLLPRQFGDLGARLTGRLILSRVVLVEALQLLLEHVRLDNDLIGADFQRVWEVVVHRVGVGCFQDKRMATFRVHVARIRTSTGRNTVAFVLQFRFSQKRKCSTMDVARSKRSRWRREPHEWVTPAPMRQHRRRHAGTRTLSGPNQRILIRCVVGTGTGSVQAVETLVCRVRVVAGHHCHGWRHVVVPHAWNRHRRHLRRRHSCVRGRRVGHRSRVAGQVTVDVEPVEFVHVGTGSAVFAVVT